MRVEFFNEKLDLNKHRELEKFLIEVFRITGGEITNHDDAMTFRIKDKVLVIEKEK